MKANKFIRGFLASALGLAAVSMGATASAQQAVVVAENDDDDVSGPDPFLFNSGLVTTGLPYTPALIVAVNSDRSEDKYLYAPFVGPWLDLAARDDDSKVNRTLLVVDGVFQTIGALQLIASFMFIDRPSRTVAASEDERSLVSEAVVTPARLNDGGYGLVAMGRF